MTKKTIHETLTGDWIHDLDQLTVARAIEWFKEYPANAVLDVYWSGYEDVQGDIDISREETDEEYSCRLQYEQEQMRFAQEKAAKKVKDDQCNIDMAIARMQKDIETLQKTRPK